MAQIKQCYTFTLYFSHVWVGTHFSDKISSLLASMQEHISEPTASSSKYPEPFPWPFQSDCKGPRCSRHRRVYCRIKSSYIPSQRALYCTRRDCQRVPADSVLIQGHCFRRQRVSLPRGDLVRFETSAHLPISTEPPKQVLPAPDDQRMILPLSMWQRPTPTGTAL